MCLQVSTNSPQFSNLFSVQFYQQRTADYIEWFYNEANFPPSNDNADNVRNSIFDVSTTVEIESQIVNPPINDSKRRDPTSGVVQQSTDRSGGVNMNHVEASEVGGEEEEEESETYFPTDLPSQSPARIISETYFPTNLPSKSPIEYMINHINDGEERLHMDNSIAVSDVSSSSVVGSNNKYPEKKEGKAGKEQASMRQHTFELPAQLRFHDHPHSQHTHHHDKSYTHRKLPDVSDGTGFCGSDADAAAFRCDQKCSSNADCANIANRRCYSAPICIKSNGYCGESRQDSQQRCLSDETKQECNDNLDCVTGSVWTTGGLKCYNTLGVCDETESPVSMSPTTISLGTPSPLFAVTPPPVISTSPTTSPAIPTVDTKMPTYSPTLFPTTTIVTFTPTVTTNGVDECPANEPYVELSLVITISYKLRNDEVADTITLDEILSIPFSKKIYREIYRINYLKRTNEGVIIDRFEDLSCTTELEFKLNTEPTLLPTLSPSYNPSIVEPTGIPTTQQPIIGEYL